MTDHNLYATDGKCHNSEPGTFGHECGKPATWIGATAGAFHSGFCDDCKEHGWEARRFVVWRRADRSWTSEKIELREANLREESEQKLPRLVHAETAYGRTEQLSFGIMCF